MFSSEYTWVMILGICMSLGFIMGSSYFVYKLWVGDYILYRKIRSIFGFNNSEEVDEFFKEYFNQRYNVDVKRVASEGGYHKVGDNLDDADPWLDEFDT